MRWPGNINILFTNECTDSKLLYWIHNLFRNILLQIANNLAQQVTQLKAQIEHAKAQSIAAKEAALQVQKAQCDKEKNEVNLINSADNALRGRRYGIMPVDKCTIFTRVSFKRNSVDIRFIHKQHQLKRSHTTLWIVDSGKYLNKTFGI